METIAFFTLLTFFASFIGTLSGFGSATIMVPVLAMFLPFAPALLLTGLIHLFNDLWKVFLFRKGIEWKLILPFGIPAIFGTMVGSAFIFTAPDTLLSRTLGVFILFYATFLLSHKYFKLSADTGTAITGGLISGFFSGIFGLGGAIRAAFLSGYQLPPAVFLSTIGVIALLTDLARVMSYISGGVTLDSDLLGGFVAFIPATFLGAVVAKYVLENVENKQYRHIVAIFLFLAGLKLVILP